MNNIGTDVHISTLDFKVVNNPGKVIMAKQVPTSALNFINFVKSVPRPRQVIIEEGSLADWLMEICLKNNEKLIISDPKRNHWIGSSEQKEDPIDAEKLAQLARGGYIKEIHHPVGHRRRFRELVMAYHDTVKSAVRIKNKIKAKFMQNGISCCGQTVYSSVHREQWRKKLPQEPTLLIIIDNLWEQLDQLQEHEETILKEIEVQSKRYPEIELIDEIPGIGTIISTTIVAILETPHRFADKRKVWAYAGLGIKSRSSGNKIYAEKLGQEYNRTLKYVVKDAAQAALNCDKDNSFRRTYSEMTIRKGISDDRAKLTISRDIIATAWAMWKKGEHYNPEIDKQLKTKTDGKVKAC
jgi:transposase